VTATAKRRIPFYYWPLWMVVLAAGLFVFYVVFTPIWMGIRFVSWLADRRGLQESPTARES
jgi:hypothetical protein